MAVYVPYIDPQVIKGRLYGLVNFGDGGGSTFTANSGGIIVTDDQLNGYQKQGEGDALRYLSTLYFIPLQHNVTGLMTLDDFSSLTSSSLESWFIASTCLKVVNFVFGNAAARRDMTAAPYKEEVEQAIEFCMRKDEAQGVVIPALEDLKLSHYYLTRQENPIPSFDMIYNVWMPQFDRITSISRSECKPWRGPSRGISKRC